MAKYKGKGTKLQYSTDSGTTFVDVAQVIDVSPPGQSGNSIQATTHDSVGNHHEFIAGLRDGGEVPLSIAYDPEDTASHAKLEELFDSGEVVTWRVVFPTANNPHLQFDGFVNNFGGATPQDDVITADCGIKVTGKPVLTKAPA